MHGRSESRELHADRVADQKQGFGYDTAGCFLLEAAYNPGYTARMIKFIKKNLLFAGIIAVMTACTDSGPISSVAEVSQLINDHRTQQGLSPLVWNDNVADVAQAHCDDMIANDYFSHTSYDGSSYTDRLDAGGVSYSAAGEICIEGAPSAQAAVDAWLASPGHLNVIEDARFTHLGIGHTVERNLYTVDFIAEP